MENHPAILFFHTARTGSTNAEFGLPDGIACAHLTKEEEYGTVPRSLDIRILLMRGLEFSSVLFSIARIICRKSVIQPHAV